MTKQKLAAWFGLLWMALAGLMLLSPLASAATSPKSSNSSQSSNTTTTSTPTITEAFGADSSLQLGELVKNNDKDSSKVEAVSQADQTKLLGVVISANDSAVTLTNSASSQQVYVANTGNFDALVSSQNGPIKVGDYIAISSIAGVGMKADANQTIVLGKALGNFDGSKGIGSAQVKVGSKNAQLSLQRIPVAIAIAHNPLKIETTSGGLPGILQKASFAIVQKTVTPARVYIASVLLIGAVVIAGTTLYGGIHSGIVSIGRNPLAKSAITLRMMQVIFMSVIIFVVGLGAVYLLLKL